MALSRPPISLVSCQVISPRHLLSRLTLLGVGTSPHFTTLNA